MVVYKNKEYVCVISLKVLYLCLLTAKTFDRMSVSKLPYHFFKLEPQFGRHYSVGGGGGGNVSRVITESSARLSDVEL